SSYSEESTHWRGGAHEATRSPTSDSRAVWGRRARDRNRGHGCHSDDDLPPNGFHEGAVRQAPHPVESAQGAYPPCGGHHSGTGCLPEGNAHAEVGGPRVPGGTKGGGRGADRRRSRRNGYGDDPPSGRTGPGL